MYPGVATRGLRHRFLLLSFPTEGTKIVLLSLQIQTSQEVTYMSITQQKKARERKKLDKAKRKKEQRMQKKLEKDAEGNEVQELKLLDGPVYFTDYDEEDIRI